MAILSLSSRLSGSVRRWQLRTAHKVASTVRISTTKVDSIIPILIGLVTVYLYAPKDHEAAVFQSQVSTIVTLTKGCKTAKVVRDIKDVPKGCHSAIITGTLSVYVRVQVSGD
jgi:hypothetical protein